MKLTIYDGTRTYMYPNGSLAAPETVCKDFPAILTFPHVVTTDDAEQVFLLWKTLPLCAAETRSQVHTAKKKRWPR